jgi:uncharacterized protein (DUF1697 family)
MFLWQEVDDPKTLQEFQFDPAMEDLKYYPGAVVWRIAKQDASKSKVLKVAGSKLYRQMTIRNPNTVRKIYQLMLG